MSKFFDLKSDRLLIFIIFAAALLLRIFYLADYKEAQTFPVMQHSDGYSYFLWAKDIASLDFWGSKAFMKWPLYAYFLGFLFRIFGENIAFVYLIQFIFGSLSCVLVYVIATKIFNRACAFIAALLCVWYGIFIFYDGLLIYTSLSIFLNLLFFLFLQHIQNRLNSKDLFLAGIFLGICALTQGNVIIFGIVSILWLLWLKEPNLKTSLKKLILFCLGLLLIIGAVTFRNYMVEKDFVPIAGNIGVTLYIGNNRDAEGKFFCPELFKPNQEGMFRDSRIIAEAATGKVLKTSQVSGFWVKKSLEFIKSDPFAYLRLLGRKVIYLFSPSEFIHDNDWWPADKRPNIFKVLFMDLRLIMPLFMLGLLINLKNFKKNALLYFYVVTFSLSIIMFFVVTRYRIMMVPIMSIFASSSIIAIWNATCKKKLFKAIALFVAAVLLGVCFIFIGKKTFVAGNYSFGTYTRSLNEAVDYMEKGDYNRAIRKLNEIQPQNHYSVFCFGVIAYNKKYFAAAEAKFKESIRMNPYFFDGFYNLGVMYNAQNRFAEAREMLEKTALMDPDSYLVHFELAKAYKGMGELKKAKEEFSLSLKKINRWRTEEKEMIEKELSLLKD